MRALSINLCGAAELRSCGAAELRRYPYDGTAGTHRKRLVNFRNILAISLCAPIHWTPPIYDILFLNFSQGAILRSFTYSNSFGFDRRRLGRLSGRPRPRTDLTDDLLPVHTIRSDDYMWTWTSLHSYAS